MALVSVGVVVPLRHAAAGGNAELRDHHRNGVVSRQHGEVGPVGVEIAVFIHKLQGIIQSAGGPVGEKVQIVRVVRIHMVGGKLAGEELLRTPDMLHIHIGAFHEKALDRLRIIKGIGGGPVGEGHQLLHVVALRLVGDDRITHLRKQRLKGTGILRGVEIGAGVRVMGLAVAVFLVCKDNCEVLPFHAQDIADHPGRDVILIGTVAG